MQQGSVAIVTGASSGIGAAVALALAKTGATVVLAARRKSALDGVAESIGAAGGVAQTVSCDVADPESVTGLFEQVDQEFGRIDLLVNNAGTLAHHSIEKMPLTEWDRVVAVNLRGLFLCSQAAFGRMRAQGGGRIINIGSLSAKRVRPNNAAYNATKFAVEGFTQSLALEGRPHGISVGMLHPGNTRSEITDRPDFPEALMEAAEVAKAVLLMASAPPDVNILEVVMHPIAQPFIGRG